MFLARLYERLLGRGERVGPSGMSTTVARSPPRDDLLDLEEGVPAMSGWSYSGGPWGREADFQVQARTPDAQKLSPFQIHDAGSPKHAGSPRRARTAWEVVAVGNEAPQSQVMTRGGGPGPGHQLQPPRPPGRPDRTRGLAEVEFDAGIGLGGRVSQESDVERACESPDSCIVHSDASDGEEEVLASVSGRVATKERDVAGAGDARDSLFSRYNALAVGQPEREGNKASDGEVFRCTASDAVASTSGSSRQSQEPACESRSQSRVLMLPHSKQQHRGADGNLQGMRKPVLAGVRPLRLSSGERPIGKIDTAGGALPLTPSKGASGVVYPESAVPSTLSRATSASLHPEPIEPATQIEPFSSGSFSGQCGIGSKEAPEACTVVEFMQQGTMSLSSPETWQTVQFEPPPTSGRHSRGIGSDVGAAPKEGISASDLLITRQRSLPIPKMDDLDAQLPNWLLADPAPGTATKSGVPLIPAVQGNGRLLDGAADVGRPPANSGMRQAVKTPRGAPRPMVKTPRGLPNASGGRVPGVAGDQGNRLYTSQSLNEVTSGDFYSSLAAQRQFPGLEGVDRPRTAGARMGDRKVAPAPQSQERPQSAVPTFSRPRPESMMSASPRRANSEKRLLVNGPRFPGPPSQESTGLGGPAQGGRFAPPTPPTGASKPLNLKLDLQGSGLLDSGTRTPGAPSGKGGWSPFAGNKSTATQTPRRGQVSAFHTYEGATPFDDAASDSTEGEEQIGAWGVEGGSCEGGGFAAGVSSSGSTREDGDKRQGLQCMMSRHSSINAMSPVELMALDDESNQWSLEDPPDRSARLGRKGVHAPSHSVDYPAHFTPVTYQSGADEDTRPLAPWTLGHSEGDALDLAFLDGSSGRRGTEELCKTPASFSGGCSHPVEISSHELDLRPWQFLNKGGSSVVYASTWRGQPVAIKLIPTSDVQFMQQRPNVMKEFKRELMVLKALPPHPNVLRLLGAVTQDPERMCLVMEFCKHGSLYEVLHDSKFTLTWHLVYSFALGIAKGMAHLHNAKTIHRDLKSGNLLVDENMDIKVGDFGLSRKQMNAFPMTGGVGTYQYSAPEVLSSEMYSEKADIYSFGTVLWECCTRREPYRGVALGHVVRDVMDGVRLAVPGSSPASLRDLISACWCHDPPQRPSFDDILHTLNSRVSRDIIAMSYDSEILLPPSEASR
eukprot:evm.model.scf_1563.1 EVM.evm.TU.scf_1563.1   scf_1563:259-9406(-)